MKLITRDTDYALRALLFMAGRKERRVSVSQLVESLGVPRPFLRKLLQALTRHGILRSHKGFGGGFRLGKASGEIFLLDLMRIFQGPFELNECLFKSKICPNRRFCSLRRKISGIEKNVINELNRITIGSLLKENRHGKKKNN